MNRNTEAKFSEVSTIELPRSSWTREFTHKTSLNAGKLVPFLYDPDIFAGFTIKNSTSIVLRMSTAIVPPMDNLYCDTYYFKCSKWWYWEHFRAMMGENDYGAWTQSIEYTEPMCISKNSAYTYGPNDLATYIGNIQGVDNSAIHKIAINCYIDVWNQWFRSQALQAPVVLDTTDADVYADGTISTGCGLLPVNKFFDYFTSALPEPQKGNAVQLPLGTSAPVNIFGNGKALGLTDGTNTGYLYNYGGSPNSEVVSASNVLGSAYQSQTLGNTSIGISTDSTKSGIIGIADLSNAVAATVNAQRLAFATQRILEKDARYGTRYREILRGHFGVTPNDETLKTPEYLGGKRIPINIQTVLQNSETSATSPLGDTGAYSVTTDFNEDFVKSFDKDSILIGVMCIRADHTYQQGIRPALTRKRRLDRYWPSLAHIGNQPIYNKEIYAQGASVLNSDGKPVDDDVFGYKEAWQEYITPNNRITGEMSSLYAQSLDFWHYGDDYSSLPVLSDAWLQEPTEYIDRTLYVQSSTANQFWADIYVKQEVAAPIPLNRTPGLLDHY